MNRRNFGQFVREAQVPEVMIDLMDRHATDPFREKPMATDKILAVAGRMKTRPHQIDLWQNRRGVDGIWRGDIALHAALLFGQEVFDFDSVPPGRVAPDPLPGLHLWAAYELGLSRYQERRLLYWSYWPPEYKYIAGYDMQYGYMAELGALIQRRIKHFVGTDEHEELDLQPTAHKSRKSTAIDYRAAAEGRG